jgi:hypothetical protein
MNYGEILIHWYLRLNGFLLLQDFVLHKGAARRGQSSDVDLLGVRFPYVYEPIGGQVDDWDEAFFSMINGTFLNSPTAIIAEVKTGCSARKDIEKSFSARRVTRALRRLGIWQDCSALCSALSEARSVRYGVNAGVFLTPKRRSGFDPLPLRPSDLKRLPRVLFLSACSSHLGC